MVSGGGAVGGEIFVNIRTEGGAGSGGGAPGAGGTPGPAGGGRPPKDPGMSLLNDKQKEQLEGMRGEKKALKEYQDFQKLKQKEGQNELINELQRGRRQATMVAGAVTTGMLARNSKIMSTTMGSLSQMFGAFIDIFLMPFIPLIIPVLKYIADLIPRWQEWTQKFADLFAEDPVAALRWAGEEFKKQVIQWGIDIGAMLGFSKEEVEQFYLDVATWASDAWSGIQSAWTTSVEYIQGIWEESGCSVWGSIKLVAEDAWCAAITGSKAAWDAFEEWQPTTAAAIEGAWCGASDYVRDSWEEGGCSVWGTIKVVGADAMCAIRDAGEAAWCAFAEWQPEVAATITSAWCGASTYVTDAWCKGGETVPGFFEVVAKDVGSCIKTGLKWLWEESGFKSKLLGILDSIQTWIFQKTGIGSAAGGRYNLGTGTDPETGARVPLSEIGAGREYSTDVMTSTGPTYARPPGWAEFFGRGDYDTGMMAKDFGRSLGRFNLSKFGGPDIDLLGQKEGKPRDIYEKFIEETSLPAHAANLESEGYGVGAISDYIKRVVREDYPDRFSVVSGFKENGKWKFEVNLTEGFNPDDTIDGMRIS